MIITSYFAYNHSTVDCHILSLPLVRWRNEVAYGINIELVIAMNIKNIKGTVLFTSRLSIFTILIFTDKFIFVIIIFFCFHCVSFKLLNHYINIIYFILATHFNAWRNNIRSSVKARDEDIQARRNQVYLQYVYVN